MKVAGRWPRRSIVLACFASLLAAAPATAATASDSLKATTLAPWNPPGPVHARRFWERAVLLPGRIATLPLSGLGYLTDHALLNIERLNLFGRATYAARHLSERSGIKLRAADFETRSGLGGAVIFTTPFLGGTLRNRLRAETALTVREYHRTVFGIQGHPGLLQYGYEWRPEERFYGIGLATSEDSATAYAAQHEFVRYVLRWAWNRADAASDPRTEIRLWAGPRTAVTRTGREETIPSFDTRFGDVAASVLDRRVDHLVYGVSFSTDWRTGVQRWTGGWRFHVLGERYDRPVPWLALKSGRPEGAQFTRFVAETETGVSFMRDPRSLRFLVRVVDHGVTSGRDRFLLSDMAALGGSGNLAGFELGRFHDLDLVLGRVAYVFPLVRRLELDLHTEAGGVYSDLWNEARLGSLETSYGLALRGRLKDRSFGSVGVDFSRETARLHVSLGSVE